MFAAIHYMNTKFPIYDKLGFSRENMYDTLDNALNNMLFCKLDFSLYIELRIQMRTQLDNELYRVLPRHEYTISTT